MHVIPFDYSYRVKPRGNENVVSAIEIRKKRETIDVGMNNTLVRVRHAHSLYSKKGGVNGGVFFTHDKECAGLEGVAHYVLGIYIGDKKGRVFSAWICFL